VAHVGEELAFRLARRLGGLLGGSQLRLLASALPRRALEHFERRSHVTELVLTLQRRDRGFVATFRQRRHDADH
jgi:hypothetical protein